MLPCPLSLWVHLSPHFCAFTPKEKVLESSDFAPSPSTGEGWGAYKGRYFPKCLFFNGYYRKEYIPWAPQHTRSPTPPPSGGRLGGGHSVDGVSPSFLAIPGFPPPRLPPLGGGKNL